MTAADKDLFSSLLYVTLVVGNRFRLLATLPGNKRVTVIMKLSQQTDNGSTIMPLNSPDGSTLQQRASYTMARLVKTKI